MSADYLRRARTAPPHPGLLNALAYCEAPGLALDLGCGAGRDSLELLRRGWQVIALDTDPAALDCLHEQTPAEHLPRLLLRRQRFENCELPRVDLINAAFSLPFCQPSAFPSLWLKITQALAPGGLFCGHLFGPDDDWNDGHLCIHDQAQVEGLLDGWQCLEHRALEFDGKTAMGSIKHWHLFEIARRPPAA